MLKLRPFLIGWGFLWVFLSTTSGSILGAKINLIRAAQSDPAWLVGWEKMLLTSAHAHVNLMGITTILFGLTSSQISGRLFFKTAVFSQAAAPPIFGFGLCLEAYHPPYLGQISWFTAVSAVGGALYILSVGLWCAVFFAQAFSK